MLLDGCYGIRGLLRYPGWLLRCCYSVSVVLWVVARVLLDSAMVYGVVAKVPRGVALVAS